MEIVVRLFSHFTEHPEQLPSSWAERLDDYDPARTAADFVSGMTDEFARRTYNDLFVPRFEEL
jgi:dGTPase